MNEFFTSPEFQTFISLALFAGFIAILVSDGDNPPCPRCDTPMQPVKGDEDPATRMLCLHCGFKERRATKRTTGHRK